MFARGKAAWTRNTHFVPQCDPDITSTVSEPSIGGLFVIAASLLPTHCQPELLSSRPLGDSLSSLVGSLPEQQR